LSLGTVAFSTSFVVLMRPYFTLVDVAMLYILGIVLVSSFTGKWPSLLATLLSVASLNFFFVPPFYTFSVHDTRYILTFAVMFIVAFVITRLTIRVREQANARL
jgi:two-component system sensor histidine kinase KdpD